VSDRPDLVVAGSGGGLVAALAAAEQGASVLVVDSSPHFLQASNTAMSTAMIPGAGSRFQVAAGIDDRPALLVDDIVVKTHGEADQRLSRSLAEVSAILVEWLADYAGIPIELVTDFEYPGHSVHRCHTVPGRTGVNLLRFLHERASQDPNIDLLVPARLSGLRRRGELSGWSIQLTYPDKTTEDIDTPALLLATSGFAADRELVARHVPEISGAVYHGSDQARGDALRLGAEVGADVAFLDAYQGHGALTVGANTLAGWALVMHGGIIVNQQGERFADETQGYSEFAALELAQPGDSSVIVFDERIRQLCRSFEDFRQTEQAGVVLTADNIPDLATRLVLDPGRLEAAIQQVAGAVLTGIPDTFGRSRWPDEPLRPPYSAVRVAPALFHTQGGLRVDQHARVLDAEGIPLPGLYAAGGAAMGISGHGAAGYLAGNGLLAALGLAFIAARHVAGQPASRAA
jgi:fumarate reductase flavoprotein subunit